MTDSELKPCPCGQVPKRLLISCDHERPRWAMVAGNCCGEWNVEFRNGHELINSDQSMRLAREAWNSAQRPATPDAEGGR